MKRSLSRYILQYRVLLLAIIGVFTLTMFILSQNTEIAHDFAKVIPEDDKDYVTFKEFKQTFGADDNILVIGLEGKDFFSLKNFNALFNLSHDLKNIEAVDKVINLTQALLLRKNDSLKKFETYPISISILETQNEADSLKKLFYSQPFYSRLLVNKTGTSAILGVTIKKSSLDSRDKNKIVNEITKLTDSFAEKTGIKVHYAGLPYVRAYNTEKIPQELRLFLLLSVIVTAGALFLFFRRLNTVIFPLILLAISIICSMGLIGLFGYKLTLLLGLIPPLVVVTSIPNSIYLVSKYHSEYKRTGNKYRAILNMLKKMGLVTFMINANNAFGYLTLYFTNVVPLQQFGIIACLSTLITYVVSIILIPGVFSMLPKPSEKNTRYLDSKLIDKMIGFMESLVKKRKGLIYITTAVLILIAIVGTFRIKAISYMVDDLPEDSRVYADLRFVEKNFNGVMPLEIIVNTGKRNGLLKMKNLKKIEKLQIALSKYPEISVSTSVVDLLKAARQSFFNGDPTTYQLPPNEELLFIQKYFRNMGKGSDDNPITNLIDSVNQKGRITANIKDVGSYRIPQILDSVRSDIKEIFGEEEAKTVAVTGTTLIFMKANDYLINNLGWSLLATLVIIGLQMFLLFRSFKIAMLSIIANLIPLIIIAGAMGFLGVPLKPSTVLIFGIAFGIAIDNSIHYLASYRHELKRTGKVSKAAGLALWDSGKGIIFTTGILFFGFVIFMASEFGGTKALGLLTSVTLIIAMFSNLLILPAMMESFTSSKITGSNGSAIIDEYEE